MNNIILITANTRNLWRPSGLEYVAEGLAETGYGVHLLDLAVEDEPEKTVKECITKNNYDAIGISIFNTQNDTGRDQVEYYLPEIRNMVIDIKEITGSPVILGGYGFSMQPEDTLEYVGGDYGIAGCGIPALPNLLEKISINAIKTGTVVREHSGKYLDTGFKRNIVNADKYLENETVFVAAQEGCLGNCYHCPFGSKKVGLRLREVSRIIEEVHNLSIQGIKKVRFATCMINTSVEYIMKLCEGLNKLPIEWSANVHPAPKYLPMELVDAMKNSGMFQAQIGSRVTGSDKMLKASRQVFNIKDMEYALKLFKEREIETSLFIGLGVPGESRETIDETFTLIDRTQLDEAEIITRARIYRNTELFNIAVNEGIVLQDDKLLEPTYYPFADELRDYIWEEADKRENCHVYY